MAETRLEAAVNAVVDKIIEDTGITCSITLENVVIGGGTAQDGAPITFTIAFNGKPTVTDVTDTSSVSGNSDP